MAKQRNQRIRDPNARLQNIRKMPVDEQLREIRDALIDLWGVSSYFITRETGNYQVTGNVAHEIIIMDNTSTATVTMQAQPKDNAQVTVVRANAQVNIAGNGKMINDGATSTTTLTLTGVGDAPNLRFPSDDNEWWSM